MFFVFFWGGGLLNIYDETTDRDESYEQQPFSGTIFKIPLDWSKGYIVL